MFQIQQVTACEELDIYLAKGIEELLKVFPSGFKCHIPDNNFC
jgi:hypothetical protein